MGGGRAGKLDFFRYLPVRFEATLDRLHPSPRATSVAFDELVHRLGAALETSLQPFLDEPEVASLERRAQTATLNATLPAVYDADPGLARLCYALVRALRPEVVVETGVANGVISSFLLQALELNGLGFLHSIDLPPPGTNPTLIGQLVPAELRGRWTLHRGASKNILPGLVTKIGPIGLFVHDSRHTYRNVSRELKTISPRLARPAAVIVDDAERHSALHDWAERAGAAVVELAEEPGKPALFGVAALAG